VANRGNSGPIKLNVCGEVTEVTVHKGWDTIAPITTQARMQTAHGERPFDNFEVRTSTGVLLNPYAAAGDWLDGETLFVNLLPGVGG
jgi:hypothetical protein